MYDSLDDGFTAFVSVVPIFVICLIAVTMGCVCGCRKQNPKNELLGLAGMVKLRNPDGDYSTLHPPGSGQQLLSVSHQTNTDRNSYNSHQRVNGSVSGGGGAVSRSLPDLPVGVSSIGTQDNPQDMGYPDTTSDLYATLDLDGEGRKRREDVETPGDDIPGTSGSPSYIQSSEERYARVGDEERIPAASAIAGIVPANHDLPYMTPPPQPNFSGDSHDSHKGYTSISVREPLSRIMRSSDRRSEGGNTDRGITHPHYATLSDVDSDDMYAAIEENNGHHGSDTYARIDGAKEIGDYATSESETYAQIGPRVPPLHAGSSEERGDDICIGDYGTSGSETYAQIQPRNNNNTSMPLHVDIHSSLYQGGGDTTSPNSLRKEKREANSPLPEPPSPLSGHSSSSGSKNHHEDVSPLDAMYAKVIKKQKSTDSNSPTPNSPPPQVLSTEVEDRHYESLDRPFPSEPPYEKIQEKRTVNETGISNASLCVSSDTISASDIVLMERRLSMSCSSIPPLNSNIQVNSCISTSSTHIYEVASNVKLNKQGSQPDLYAQVIKSPVNR